LAVAEYAGSVMTLRTDVLRSTRDWLLLLLPLLAPSVASAAPLLAISMSTSVVAPSMMGSRDRLPVVADERVSVGWSCAEYSPLVDAERHVRTRVMRLADRALRRWRGALRLRSRTAMPMTRTKAAAMPISFAACQHRALIRKACLRPTTINIMVPDDIFGADGSVESA
jgi:hypothetical protein